MNNFLIDYTLHLADNSLILGQRNSGWCGHGPVLEQDIAISNIALDYIGEARNIFQYVAKCINESPTELLGYTLPATEDSLAYLRDVTEFKNYLITRTTSRFKVFQSSVLLSKSCISQMFSGVTFWLFTVVISSPREYLD